METIALLMMSYLKCAQVCFLVKRAYQYFFDDMLFQSLLIKT